MLTLRRLGEDFGEQFEKLSEQLDDLSTRLDALAAQVATLSNTNPDKSSPAPSVASVRKPKHRRRTTGHDG